MLEKYLMRNDIAQVEKYLMWNDIAQVEKYCKRDFCIRGNNYSSDVTSELDGFPFREIMPEKELEINVLGNIAILGGGVSAQSKGMERDSNDTLKNGIEEAWKYCLRKNIGTLEPLIKTTEDLQTFSVLMGIEYKIVDIDANKAFVLNCLRKTPEVFKADFCRNLYINCLYFMEKNKRTQLDEDEKEFRRIKKQSFLESREKFTCTLHAVCKQLECNNVNSLYMLDKLIGFSIAAEAVAYPNKNENDRMYSLIQDGQRLIVDKIAKIEYPYIRKSIYDLFFHMLEAILAKKNLGIKDLVEFYDVLQRIDIIGINTEIWQIMCQFYDYIIQVAYRCGAVRSNEGNVLVQTLYRVLKSEGIERKKELDSYINKTDVQLLESWLDEKSKRHFKEITNDIYMKMNGK